MRYDLLESCMKEIGIRRMEEGDNVWEQVIDNGISSLRMLYSPKFSACPDCKISKKSISKTKSINDFYKGHFQSKSKTFHIMEQTGMICPNCNNDGFIISNRVYEFHSIMDYDGKILTSGPLLNLLKSDKLQQIYASSLRTVFNLENHLPDETERIKIPDNKSLG